MNKITLMALCGLVVLASLLCGCNRNVAESSSPESLVIFPPPPDTTRIQFLTQISSSADLKGKRGAFHRYLFGEEEALVMVKPYGITGSFSLVPTKGFEPFYIAPYYGAPILDNRLICNCLAKGSFRFSLQRYIACQAPLERLYGPLVKTRE